jgi:hypothetical protein
MDLSIIIPFSHQEDRLPVILSDLKKIILEGKFEIILLGESDINIPNDSKVFFVKSKLGRVDQLNRGAQVARGRLLWFLHADSEVALKDFKLFYHTLLRCPNDLTYFNLKFSPPSKKMFLNEIGAKIRSDIFSLPFGDQGLCVSKENFQKLGAFPQVPIGEDLAFVILARKNGIRLNNCGANIVTSSRKYEKNGWIKTTLIHLFYTIKLFFSFWFGAKTI